MGFLVVATVLLVAIANIGKTIRSFLSRAAIAVVLVVLAWSTVESAMGKYYGLVTLIACSVGFFFGVSAAIRPSEWWSVTRRAVAEDLEVGEQTWILSAGLFGAVCAASLVGIVVLPWFRWHDYWSRPAFCIAAVLATAGIIIMVSTGVRQNEDRGKYVKKTLMFPALLIVAWLIACGAVYGMLATASTLLPNGGWRYVTESYLGRRRDLDTFLLLASALLTAGIWMFASYYNLVPEGTAKAKVPNRGPWVPRAIVWTVLLGAVYLTAQAQLGASGRSAEEQLLVAQTYSSKDWLETKQRAEETLRTGIEIFSPTALPVLAPLLPVLFGRFARAKEDDEPKRSGS